MPEKQKAHFFLLLAAIAAAWVCHMLFSPYGFNPTDEGFVLSSSMRLLHGQVPHVDFSSLRPLGYAWLHIPELLISREHTFLISRFVFWVELSAIAYTWTLILLNSSKYDLRSTWFITGVFLFLITFIFNAHDFPMAVLHTIDGLLFALIGFYIVMKTKRYAWLGGIFIGYAVLCKQGFAVLIPLSIILFPGNIKAWAGSLVPGFVYGLCISALGGWGDLFQQLGAHTELLEVGILNYILNPWLFGGIILNFGSRKLQISAFNTRIGLTIFILILLVSGHYTGQGLMLLFGFALSESFFDPGRRTLYILALALGWCVSISVGYASIALFSGGLLAILLLPLFTSDVRPANMAAWGILLAGIICFGYVRTVHIYRDAPRARLTRLLDGTVEGAHGIRTNAHTFAVLKELDSLKRAIPGVLFLPDFTACQVFDYDRPVLTEWPNRAEVPNEAILEKITSPLSRDTTTTIAIGRYQTALLADSLILADHGEYRIIQFVLRQYKLADTCRYFRIYRHK